MLLQSSVILWTVVQVLISGSQCHPHTTVPKVIEWTPIEDNTCIVVGTKIGQTLYGVPNIADCKMQCEADKACKSVDFRVIGGDCRLSSADRSASCPKGSMRQFTEIKEPICPQHWTLVGSQCFKATPFDPHHPISTWLEARTYCVGHSEELDTDRLIDLASPKNITTLNEYATREAAGTIVWVGGYNFPSNLVNPPPKREWRWLDRRPIDIPESELTCLSMKNNAGTPILIPVNCGAAGAAEYGLVCELY